MNVEKELERILPEHMRHLKDLPVFPAECVLSSHLLAGYLKENVRIVYGTYGEKQFFHSWLEVDGRILDVTLFQFLTPKEKPGFYRKQSPEQMVEYMWEKQGSLFIEKEAGNYEPLFYPVTELEKESGQTAFSDYITAVFEGNQIQEMSWQASLNADGVSFATVLEQTGKRITRRQFTKWAIVDAG